MAKGLHFGWLLGFLAAACGASSGDDLGSTVAAQNGKAPALRPGEVAELSVANGIAGGVLSTEGPSDRYVVILASTALGGEARLSDWTITRGTSPEGAYATLVSGCSIDADDWQSATVPTEPVPTGSPVALGTTRTVHAWTEHGSEEIETKAIAVGERAIVWADVTPAHPATLDEAFVTQFLSDFERTILPRERSIFGVESDVDHDGRVGLVFTPLTRQTAVAFFTSCDLVNDCDVRNSADYLWLTPPNAIDPPYNTPNAIKEILAHELAHLVHFNRKVLRNRRSEWTDSSYMIEGVGGFAQDAIGPQSGNLYVTMAALNGIADFSLADTMIDGTRYDTDRDGVLRGGSYLFVRWLYDRAGGDVALADGGIEGRGGPALLRSLLDAPESIAHVLPRVVGRPLEDLAMDFYTTLAMSNRDQVGGPAPANPCHAYLPTETDPITGKQRGANLFGKIHGMPMKGVALQDATSGTLRSGGVAYVALPSPEGAGPLPITVRVDPAAAPRVRIARIQ